jgi:hypothetical protein
MRNCHHGMMRSQPPGRFQLLSAARPERRVGGADIRNREIANLKEAEWVLADLRAGSSRERCADGTSAIN